MIYHSIDFNSYIPYYRQLYTLLKERILSKEWKPGDRFPGEHLICQEYGISRTVVRSALLELEGEGLISRRKGKGTFVLGQKISEGLAQSLIGFYQDMAERGLHTTTQVLSQQVTRADDQVASFLALQPGEQVIQINRLRFVEGEPIAVVISYLPLHVCPALATADLSNRSLYEFLQSECGIQLARARRIFEAARAGEANAKLLKIKPSDPVVQMQSASYLDDGTPIEFFVAYHRGDRTRFEINLVHVRDKWKALE